MNQASLAEACLCIDLNWKVMCPESIKNGVLKSGVNYSNSEEILEMETNADSIDIEVTELFSNIEIHSDNDFN